MSLRASGRWAIAPGPAAALGALLALLATLAPASADAQVRFRRPYAESYRLNYGFDNDGGSGGCRDYACGGACYNGHSGEDFGLPRGTGVRAAQSGTVTASYDGCANTGYVGNPCGGRCGNYVQLQHSDGSRTIYCHMERGSLRVGRGQSVSCGQLLGRSASSGSSSGPHLHFGYKPSATSSSRELFRGSCGRSSSLWVQQNGYREAPGTACSTCSPRAESCNGRDDDCDGRIDEGVTRSCSTACGSGTQRCSSGSWGGCSARSPTDERCNGEDDDCDGTVDDEDVCEVRLLHRQPSAYAPPSSTDFDGDGRADMCARGYSGVRCWAARDGGWADAVLAAGWADDRGWDDVTNFATLRMGDVDGDGRADVCARANAGVTCVRAGDGGFVASAGLWHDGISDANGWGHPRNYTTLRLGDVDGDGRADLCARANAGMRCWLSDGERFATQVVGPEWSNAVGFGQARHYGTIRLGDVNGDRRADLCARTAEGMECWLSDGAGFPTRVAGPGWANARGWGDMRYWSTIRLADVDGDGRADLCARSASSLACHLSSGDGFGEAQVVAALSDDSGWGDESNYASLRIGDVDGDGTEDLCARANAGIRCWARDGDGFRSVSGPEWSDANGWHRPRFYQTIRLADVNGDGLDDLCGRAAAGWRCHVATGEGFAEAPVTLDDLSDSGGWDALRFWSTILTRGRACIAEDEVCNARDDDCDGLIDEDGRPEMCNALDDDCDGEIDEDGRPEMCNALDDDCDGEVDEHATAEQCNGVDDDCDGEVDEHAGAEVAQNGLDDDCDGMVDEVVVGPGGDGGLASAGDGGGSAGDGGVGGGDGRSERTIRGGCACRIGGSALGRRHLAGARGSAPWVGLGALGLLALTRARRRRRLGRRRG